MLSATLKDGLTEYAIGEKIRALRLKKKIGLVELGRHTGLSPALLSKIERGRIFPTLPTLLRIALVFSVGLDYFFAGAREKPMLAVARKPSRISLPDRPGRATPRTALNRSTTRPPSGGSTPTMRSFCRSRRTAAGHTAIPAWSSST